MSWKPLGDYMIVEKFESVGQGLVLPEDVKIGDGDIFTVIETGAGFYTESGQLIPYDIQAGDKVMIAGKLLRLPGEKALLIARQADALAVRRDSIDG